MPKPLTEATIPRLGAGLAESGRANPVRSKGGGAGRTREIFDIHTLVAYVSAVVTLEPGDLILTGTPPGVGYFRDPKVPLIPGDLVEVDIEWLRVLANPVVVEGDAA